MDLKEEDIRLIFGLKLRRARQAMQFSLAQLSQATGLSVSYLNEIEKGRKYPKAEKVAALAAALGTTYDKLVSLKLDKHLAPVGELLENGFLKDVPLDLFGIDRGKLVELIANAPAKVSAFISTLARIAANYNLSQEHFYFAALRSYQELHENHFPELEQEAQHFRSLHALPAAEALHSAQLRTLLTTGFGYEVRETDLREHPELLHIRSVFIPEKRRLLINARLAEDQKAFLFAKELGYAFLGLAGQRALMTPWPRATSFDHVLNNSKASYFGGALLLPAAVVVPGIRAFLAHERWNEGALLRLLASFNSTPEMFMLRLTNLLVPHFGLQGLFFQRFDHHRSGQQVELRKELFLDRSKAPGEIEVLNDGVGAWLQEALFPRLEATALDDMRTLPVAAVQRFTAEGRTVLVLAIGRRMGRDPQRSLAVCIGVNVNPANEKVIGFLHDPGIGTRTLALRPVLAEREARFQRINAAMQRLMQEQLRS
ncbi:MAG: helix-turn-helix domain-containing protein [Flavobacteriales bacterium]|jgi:hypothetical protein|nr:helix-turn-helix domain-containing protein [Flavobacteriales bacterium]